MLINCLAYFGVDLGHFLRHKDTEAKPPVKTHEVDVSK
jgi:hypothetical protein